MGGAERIGNFGATEIDASNTAAQADAPLTRAEAVKLVQSYVAAYNNRDLDAMLALQDENVVSCPARLFGGIYLIAWFGREHWADGDYRRRSCASARDLVEATYEQQASDLSAARKLVIRSVVLDGRLPERR